jgi:6-phosphogluconolactonase
MIPMPTKPDRDAAVDDGEGARSVEIYPDPDALALAAAERVVQHAREAIIARGSFTIALAGGSTPRPLYALLATAPFASRIDWTRWHVFFGDERCVPPDFPDSNYRMAREALLDRVPLPPHHVHRIAGEDEPAHAATAYERVLRAFFGSDAAPPERSFDLVLLGMGDDGHTASLMPGTAPVVEAKRWVLPNRDPHGMQRVTLTPVVLNAAVAVLFLVAGASKAERLWEVLEGPGHAPPLPVEHIRPVTGTPTFMVDGAAAARLKGDGR